MGIQLVKKSKHMMQKVFDDLAILRGVVTNVDGWDLLSCTYEIVGSLVSETSEEKGKCKCFTMYGIVSRNYIMARVFAEFPEEGRATPEFRLKTYYLARFLLKIQ